MAAAAEVKSFGRPNDLLVRIAEDTSFKLDHGDLQNLLNPLLYIGRCPEQVDRFLTEFVDPLIEASRGDLIGEQPQLRV